jgi:hypothetical protein
MKLIVFAHMIVLAIYGCGLIATKDEVQPFIPGVYARHYGDEYTDSYDTITIKPMVTAGSNGYTVTKRSRFEKLTNEGKTKLGYDLKKWTGIYDEKTKTLWLQAPGKRIYFDPNEGELKIGEEPYKKL